MSFRAERDKANGIIAAHIGESVYIDGVRVRGIPREDSSASSLGLPVQGYEIRIDIRTTDAQRIGARRGMRVEWFDVSGLARLGSIRNIDSLSSGWSSLEIET